MTIHLGWVAFVWAMAAIGTAVVLYVIVGFICLLLSYRD